MTNITGLESNKKISLLCLFRFHLLNQTLATIVTHLATAVIIVGCSPKNRWRWHILNLIMSSWYVKCLQEEYVCWRHDAYNQGEAARSDGENLFFFYFFHSAHCRLFHWISISILDFSCTHKTVWSRMARADISVPLFNLNDTVRYIRRTAINLVTQRLEAILQTHRPPFFGAPHRRVFPFF